MLPLAAALLVALSPSAASARTDQAVSVTPDRTTALLEWGPAEEVEGLPDGLCGFTADGCRTMEGLMLPVEHLYVAVPPGTEVEVSAVPGGVRSLDVRGDVPAGVGLDSESRDSLFAAPDRVLPKEWATLVEVGRYRGIRLARIDVHPVIFRGSGPVAAASLQLTVSHRGGGRPTAASGMEGRFYSELLLGGNRVWSWPRPSGRADSPFWGRPWIEVGLDTTGVYRLTGEEIPDAVGQPSSSLAMYRGRGRMMGQEPWDDAYDPIPVPILVEDGGDGIFDPSDRILFFGTGLSWWEPSGEAPPDHYTSRWDHTNRYWLTWGGEPGARMDVLDGGLTGAPDMPDSFPARVHLEEEYFWVGPEVSSGWTWFKSYGSTPETLNATFDAPGAGGSGTLRVGYVSAYTKGGGRDTTRSTIGTEIYLNGNLLVDSTFYATAEYQLEVPASGFLPGANQVSVKVWRESGSREVFIDWLEAFPQSAYHAGGQLHAPLSWYTDTGRRTFTWQGDLESAYVLFVEEDSTASLVSTADPSSFEVDVGRLRTPRSVWIAPESDLMAPASVESASPGRIVGSIDGAERVFICHPDFYEGSMALEDPDVPTAFVTTDEIYDEFNGGPTDPQAIRAFLDWAVAQWDPAPMEVVLVGQGSYDVRGFGTSEPCYVPAIYNPSTTSYPLDDYYATIQGFTEPQLAMSRISALDQQELATIVEKSLSYRSGDAAGDWQSRVIGAADDERYPSVPPVYNQWYHTVDMEAALEGHLYSRFRPVKCYEIFFDWNEQWRKPEARQDFIDQWNLGAVFIGFLGHGSHDQICDEGLLFLEDADLLQCGGRMSYSFFGSCDVGEFWRPDRSCISEAVVSVPGGGSVTSSGAVAGTIRTDNRDLLQAQMQLMLAPDPMSFAQCLLLAKMQAGYGTFTRQYILFGDGTLTPAVPDTGIQAGVLPMLTGEVSVLSGTAPGPGPVSVLAFESAQPDTYVTAESNYPIAYNTPFRFQQLLPGVQSAQAFYNGSSPGGDIGLEMFVPVDADTGSLGRVELYQPSASGGFLAALYPESLDVGTPSPTDSTGPEIDMWVQGFRNVDHPEVSGDFNLLADLADSSGINLLSEPGRQLTLYVDETPQYVAGYFTYDPGSSTSGRLEVPLSGLSPGEHQLRLRAADGLNNISESVMSVTVLEGGEGMLEQVFVYPNPCRGGTSINWYQSGAGPVGLAVYTQSGRRVYSRSDIPGDAGYNQLWWDGRDDDGDPVASGSYIYRLSAGGGGEGTGEESIGIIAVVR
ncbi:MAG: C25 family cysteine peptidase [Candidatus Fermentibacteraceae bacterium]